MPTTSRLPAEECRLEARRVIGQAPGFSGCTSGVLDDMVAAGQLKQLKRGEYLLRRGDRSGCVGMVVTGSLEASALQVDGHRHFVGLVPPGDFYGVGCFVDGLPDQHDISAREDTTLLTIANDTLQRLRAQHPSIVIACESHLARRLRLVFERLYADPGVPLESRVASMLVMVGQLYGRAVGRHIELNFKLSQTDLADWLGLSRQRINFVLKQLESERLIRLHYSLLTITDPAGLEARAANGGGQRPGRRESGSVS
jgi:CRP/FNR family cyclic AMP-dependent transcriptional regulator